jgi:GH15 family glucan-1,4-alpha-glucosidase
MSSADGIRSLFQKVIRSGKGGEGDESGTQTRRYEPIEDYALIGDRVTTALVSRTGSIDWACFPRMDSPSVFARILDAERGGHFSIQPTGAFESSRRYREGTAILDTTFTTGTGQVMVTDFMPPQSAELERLGDSAIVRIVRGVTGRVEMAIQVHPAFDYGRAEHRWDIEPGTGARATTPDESITLYSTRVEFEEREPLVEGRFETRPDEERVFILRHRKPAALMFHRGLRDMTPRALEITERYWRDWIERCAYTGAHEKLVVQSAVTLRMLDYAATGAIVAAPTTSLPETPGGIRNWDYRYNWIRDAAFTLYAFLLLGYPEEAESYLNWLCDVTAGHADSLKVLYGLGGEDETPEFILEHFEGYEGASPVRIGNGAWDQQQHDMYGEILDCAYLMSRNGGVLSETLWEMLRKSVDHACAIWRDPDHGPWEIRSAPRHFVYSKVLCWVALDRGLRLADTYGFSCDRERWERVAEEIRAEVLEKGYNEKVGAFTAAYDGEDLDAAVLALPLRRFIDAKDPRMVSTVERIREKLSFEGAPHLLRRVSPEFEDGLHGEEGSFMLCNFWVVDCLVMQGKVDEAEELFSKLEQHANDVGLYAEMVDPATGRHLGNFPQAFTHIALIVSAANIERARRGMPALEEAVAIDG